MLQDPRYELQDRGFTLTPQRALFGHRRRTPDARLVTGFTLVEILVAIGIMTLILGTVSPIGFNFYFDYQLESETRLLGTLLQQTRNLAMVNYNESDHGLYFDSANFIIFQGASFASRVTSKDKTFPRAQSISLSGPSEIVFTALSGQTASTTYALSNSRKNREVYVNAEGLVY